jgi:hypothetical protein
MVTSPMGLALCCHLPDPVSSLFQSDHSSLVILLLPKHIMPSLGPLPTPLPLLYLDPFLTSSERPFLVILRLHPPLAAHLHMLYFPAWHMTLPKISLDCYSFFLFSTFL